MTDEKLFGRMRPSARFVLFGVWIESKDRQVQLLPQRVILQNQGPVQRRYILVNLLTVHRDYDGTGNDTGKT